MAVVVAFEIALQDGESERVEGNFQHAVWLAYNASAARDGAPVSVWREHGVHGRSCMTTIRAERHDR